MMRCGSSLAGSRIDGEPLNIERLAPQLGEHTEEVLLDAGYTWEDITSLRDAGAIGRAELTRIAIGSRREGVGHEDAEGVRAGSRFDDEGIIEWARGIEAAGVDGIFVGDHVTFYGSGSDGLMKLAPIAAATSRLELQTCVYLLALRHPTPVALQAAMVDQMSNGRLMLGRRHRR